MSQKTERLLRIYSLLKRGPLTIELLKHWAEKNDIKISARTFYRDLEDLENSILVDGEELVVSSLEKNKKVWKIEYKNSSSGLNDFDINSYFLFKNFLPLPVVSARKSSLDKIVNLFYSTNSKSKFENFVELGDHQIAATHFYEVAQMEDYKQILDDCLWSIQYQREMNLIKIDFDYTSIPKHITYPKRLLPIQLLYHRGVVHVAGFLKDEQELVILALEQFKEYKITNDMFDAKKYEKTLKKEMLRRFGITQNISEEVYDIELEFSYRTGSFVRNQVWHPTQKFKQLKNGNIQLKMRCGLNRELTGWIFQWMSNVKVISPPELQKLVVEKHEEIIESYRNDLPLISNNTFRPD